MKNSALTKQVLQKMIKEEAAKFLVKKQEERKASGTIAAGRLQQIIKEEIESYLMEAPGGKSDDEQSVTSGEGASKLSDQQKEQLNGLASSSPSNLAGFSMNLKSLASIIGKVDANAASINAGQLGQYWTQIMAVVKAMMSEEKTTSSETSKVTKALG